ncbi:hypothetical protein G7A79_07180 [Coprococcus sp. MSK.21.13]|jgi:flagellar biosynthesis/type III secretory pathway protein FliH|nr:hypothetical protein [Coprococcus sp. MSK.21.13]
MKKATVLYLLVGTTALTAVTLICKQKAYDCGYEAGKNAGYKKGREDGLQDGLALCDEYGSAVGSEYHE